MMFKSTANASRAAGLGMRRQSPAVPALFRRISPRRRLPGNYHQQLWIGDQRGGSLNDHFPTPAITGQPQNRSVSVGSNAIFTVTATGGNLSYQWLFNAGSIVSATASSYTVTGAQTNNAGNYSVVVTNTQGTVTSSNALLTVNPPQPHQFLKAYRIIRLAGE